MNEWLARASRWQLGLLMGLSCGSGTAVVLGVLGGEGWTQALAGAIGAAVGGAGIGATLLHGQARRRADAVAGLPAPARRTASRAAFRGPVPEDPEARGAAYALTQQALAEHRRRRVVGVLGAVVILAMLVNLAVQGSAWWWLVVAGTLGLLVHGWFVLPGRLRSRAELLNPGAGGVNVGRTDGAG